MEDRYLYKAKRLDNGEWVVGYYAVIGGRNVIIEKCVENYYCPDICESRHGNQIHEVNSNTICQCTGLKDKNGKLIWENDIVSFAHENYTRNYAIEFKNTFHNYGLRFRNKSIHFRCTQVTLCMHDCEVIGNIFDNAGLLESEG